MKQFIRLRSIVINKNYIINIKLQNDQYICRLAPFSTNGVIFAGSGYVSSDIQVLEICKNKDPEDYKKISELIDSIDKN